MSEMSIENVQPITYDAIKIGLASPEKIKEMVSRRSKKNLRQLTIEHSNLKRTVFTVRRYSDQVRTGSAIVVNIRKSAIRALFVTDVVSKLQRQP